MVQESLLVLVDPVVQGCILDLLSDLGGLGVLGDHNLLLVLCRQVYLSLLVALQAQDPPELHLCLCFPLDPVHLFVLLVLHLWDPGGQMSQDSLGILDCHDDLEFL